MTEERIGFAEHDLHIRVADILPVIFQFQAGSTGNHRLVARIGGCHLQHGRKVVFDLLTAATCQQRQYGAFVQLFVLTECIRSGRLFLPIAGNRIDRRIAHIVHRIVEIAEKLHFERQDAEHPVHVATEILDTILFPSPYLRRDIIVDRQPQLRLYIFGNLQIEPRIIDQDHHIGPVLPDFLLAGFHVVQDRTEIEQYGDKAHESHIPVMLHQRPSDCLHKIAAQETKIRFGILLLQCCHQVGGMQITGSFARD